MPARDQGIGPLIQMCMKVEPVTKEKFDRERLKRNLSSREALLLLMDNAGWITPARKRK